MSYYNKSYRPCPYCTYPLTKMTLGQENGKFVIRTYCTNNKCNFEKISRRKKQ